MAEPTLTFLIPPTVLWRSPGVLQVGLDPDASLLLADAPEHADVALRHLAGGRSLGEIARRVPAVTARWLPAAVARLHQAGLVGEAASPGGSVVVLGNGPLADACAALLAGVRPIRTARVADAVALAAWPADLLVVVAPSLVEPDRRELGELVGQGRPHLVVRAEPERTIVGPFVSVGRSACARCTDLTRTDLDPRWPFLLAQLCRMEHVPDASGAAWAAATAVAQVRRWLCGEAPETLGATVELDARTHAFGVRPWPAHPRCGCRLGVVEAA